MSLSVGARIVRDAVYDPALGIQYHTTILFLSLSISAELNEIHEYFQLNRVWSPVLSFHL